MNELRPLIRLELRSLFGINKLRHTRDKKERNRLRLLCGVWIFLIVLVVGYVTGLVLGLSLLGAGDAVPLYLATAAVLLVFMFGIFKVGSAIFGDMGYDLLSSMPLRPQSLVLSRLAVMYMEDFLFCAAILIPGVAVYGILQSPSVRFYAVAAVGCLFLPAIPLVASILVGTLIAAISVRMKHKSLIQSLLLVLVVVGIAVASFGMQDLSGTVDETVIAELVTRLTSLLGKLYPPAAWLSDSLLGGSLWGLLGFVLFSVGSLVLGAALTMALFTRIMRGLSSVSATHDYKVGKLESRTLLRALYMRECKRYFSSSVFVSNTIIGPVLATVLTVILCIVGIDPLESALPPAVPVRTLLPFAISAVMCMMNTTSVSVSMEGKSMDTVKSLPIPEKTWLDSKILLDLTLTLPCLTLSEILLTIVAKPSPAALAGQVLTPLALVVFSAVFGITVNLRFHSFDWDREEVPVKQSLSALLGGFSGMLLSLLSGGVVFLAPSAYRNLAALIIAAALGVATYLLYRHNRCVRMETL